MGWVYSGCIVGCMVGVGWVYSWCIVGVGVGYGVDVELGMRVMIGV